MYETIADSGFAFASGTVMSAALVLRASRVTERFLVTFSFGWSIQSRPPSRVTKSFATQESSRYVPLGTRTVAVPELSGAAKPGPCPGPSSRSGR